MMKRIVSILLVVAALLLVPLLSGCADEVKTHRQVEVHDKVIHQDTVVE